MPFYPIPFANSRIQILDKTVRYIYIIMYRKPGLFLPFYILFLTLMVKYADISLSM